MFILWVFSLCTATRTFGTRIRAFLSSYHMFSGVEGGGGRRADIDIRIYWISADL